MEVNVQKLVGWEAVLRSARTTVGKKDLKKEPSNEFKKNILISEHSPIRMLTFEVVWENIPYFVAMHLRTHKIGFKASDDDIFFIETSRSDRKQINRENISQTAPVTCRAVINAQSIINMSRVRLCFLASKETKDAWKSFLIRLEEIEPILAKLCKKNCIYRGFCPERKKSCKYILTSSFLDELRIYQNYCEIID